MRGGGGGGGGGGEESIEQAICTVPTVGLLHVRATSRTKNIYSAHAAALPVVYAVYTVDFRWSTRLISRVSHVTFPTVFTVSIVRGSILFVLMNS